MTLHKEERMAYTFWYGKVPARSGSLFIIHQSNLCLLKVFCNLLWAACFAQVLAKSTLNAEWHERTQREGYLGIDSDLKLSAR